MSDFSVSCTGLIVEIQLERPPEFCYHVSLTPKECRLYENKKKKNPHFIEVSFTPSLAVIFLSIHIRFICKL